MPETYNKANDLGGMKGETKKGNKLAKNELNLRLLKGCLPPCYLRKWPFEVLQKRSFAEIVGFKND